MERNSRKPSQSGRSGSCDARLPAPCLQTLSSRCHPRFHSARRTRLSYSARNIEDGRVTRRTFRLRLPLQRHAPLLRRTFGRVRRRRQPVPPRTPRGTDTPLRRRRNIRCRHILGRQRPGTNGSEHDIRKRKRTRGYL